MAVLETYLQELEALRVTTALETLNPEENSRTEFAYGRGCGVQEGLRLAEELLQKVLSDRDRDEDDKTRTRRK